jgi:hypothetical protein
MARKELIDKATKFGWSLWKQDEFRLFVILSGLGTAFVSGKFKTLGYEFIPLVSKFNLILNVISYAGVVVVLLSFSSRIYELFNPGIGKNSMINTFLYYSIFGALLFTSISLLFLYFSNIAVKEALTESSIKYYLDLIGRVWPLFIALLLLAAAYKMRSYPRSTVFILLILSVIAFNAGARYVRYLELRSPSLVIYILDKKCNATEPRSQDPTGGECPIKVTIVVSDFAGILFYSPSIKGAAHYPWNRIEKIRHIRNL